MGTLAHQEKKHGPKANLAGFFFGSRLAPNVWANRDSQNAVHAAEQLTSRPN